MKKNQDFNNNKVWVSGATKPTELVSVSKLINSLLWLVSSAIIIFGVAITMYSNFLGISFKSYSTSIVVVVILMALVIARFTNQGRHFWDFFNASKLELAKVVWPTRKETITITVMVIIIVVVFAILISVFGLIFENFIQYFLG